MHYNRQFVILRQLADLPGFQRMDLWNGLILQYHPSLPVLCMPEKRLLLLGVAWQVMPGRKSPREEMEALVPGESGDIPMDAVERMEETWCGRYALISGSFVFMDATGKMAVYYSHEGICGNLSLLAAVCGLKASVYTPQSASLNWMPGPRTQYPEIRQCLPSQIYDLATGKIESRQLLSPVDPALTERDALIEQTVRCFDESFRNMERELKGWKLLAALTGGYDSRALLGLLKHSGVHFGTFTLGHDRISEADKTLPPVLSERAGVEYTFVPSDCAPFQKEKEDEYIAFTSGLIWDADRLFYARGQYQELVKQNGKCVFLRSAIWGTLAERYAAAFDEYGPNDVFYEWFGIGDGTLEKESLEEYLAWMRSHPQTGLRPADAFFWDQREGCWMGAIENGFDLMDGCQSLHPANCRYLLTLLSRFPREERITKAYEANIASFAFEGIRGIPYAVKEKKNKLQRIKGKLQKGMDRLSKFGFKNTVKTYLRIFSKNRNVKKNRK
ncbi:MAG: hypothetical protein IKH30_04635 [Clostridia bacterium]|nr:hypothetical protein [Clostridia bacterium]